MFRGFNEFDSCSYYLGIINIIKVFKSMKNYSGSIERNGLYF